MWGMDSTQGSKYQRQSSFTLTSVSVGVGTEDEETYGEMGQNQRWEERKDHPLFNHVILNILFEFMGEKDLKSCRLVCRKWFVSSLPSARSKFMVTLQGNSEEMTRRLTDFVEVFRPNKLGIPFVDYNLDPFCTTEGPGQEFIQICGSTAKAVTLTEEESHVSTAKVKDISEILKAMPNISFFSFYDIILSRSGNIVKLFPDNSSTKSTLSFLKKLDIFKIGRAADKVLSDCCPTFIEEILSVAPNISDILVQDSKDDAERSRIGQILNAIEKFERESVIQNLNLFNAKPEHFESLRRMAENGLKLKNLYFVKNQNEDSIKCLPQLAILFKNSIERLRVNEDCSSFLQLPHMPKLERLEFVISKDFDSKCVNLIKLFPALKELQLYYQKYDEDEYQMTEFLPNSEPCPNVKAFSLCHFLFTSQLFDHVLNIFPTLTKLHLDFERDGEQILRKIMTEMTQLEDLNVWGPIEGIESIDAFLTGIPVPKIRELEPVVTELKEMPVQLREDTIRYYMTRYCRFPYIANLTNLKRLHLSITGCDEFDDDPTMVTRLTDVFLYFGLYSMKHIKDLVINNCEFTKSGCEILTTEMGLETWTFQDEDDDDIIPQV